MTKKVRILSDIHLEFFPLDLQYIGEDILILAGDISPDIEITKKFILSYLEKNPHPIVFFVLGNHDYYGHSMEEIHQNMLNFQESIISKRFNYLQNSSVMYQDPDGNGDILFVGTTLWTDLSNGDKGVIGECQYYINDFRLIKNFTGRDFIYAHDIAKNFLEECINSFDLNNRTDNCKIVVISHHLPTYRSIDPSFSRSIVNPAFACSDIDHLIGKNHVNIWIHGHTHRTIDYDHNGTRVICNPRGYVKIDMSTAALKRENPSFNENFIIQI